MMWARGLQHKKASISMLASDKGELDGPGRNERPGVQVSCIYSCAISASVNR